MRKYQQIKYATAKANSRLAAASISQRSAESAAAAGGGGVSQASPLARHLRHGGLFCCAAAMKWLTQPHLAAQPAASSIRAMAHAKYKSIKYNPRRRNILSLVATSRRQLVNLSRTAGVSSGSISCTSYQSCVAADSPEGMRDIRRTRHGIALATLRRTHL